MDDEEETCEICFAGYADATYNVEDVEMWVCESCAVYRTLVGTVWMIKFEG